MKTGINELLKKANEIIRKHEEVTNEIFNDESFPKDLKEALIKLREESEQHRKDYEAYIEQNKQRKIIGYNSENFVPIFEDE